eukprot:349632-Chlamydomonas_euryale.AAC.5
MSAWRNSGCRVPTPHWCNTAYAIGQVLGALLATKGGGGDAGGAGVAGQHAMVATAKELLEQLPTNFDVEATQERYPISYHQSMNQVRPLSSLPLHANAHWRGFGARDEPFQPTHGDCAGVADGPGQGFGWFAADSVCAAQVMSGELEAVAGALTVGKVPQLWLAQSYPSLKTLASYMADLVARVKWFRDWADHGQPAMFWISGFFFTPSFTTAVLQNFARQQRLPIDEIGFDYEILSDVASSPSRAPPNGAYIYGMYLDGCQWDSRRKELAESQPKARLVCGIYVSTMYSEHSRVKECAMLTPDWLPCMLPQVLFVEAPVLWLRPMRMSEMKQYQHYECPVYRTAERRGVLATTGHSTNFLMMVKMPSVTVEPAVWTMRGKLTEQGCLAMAVAFAAVAGNSLLYKKAYLSEMSTRPSPEDPGRAPEDLGSD